MDKLDHMYAMQDNIERQYGYNIEAMSPRERVAFIKEYMFHVEHELHECAAELPYLKPWKVYNTVDFTKAQQEFADVLHFIMVVALGLGLTPDAMYQLFFDKTSVIYSRQQDKENYTLCQEGPNDSESSR